MKKVRKQTSWKWKSYEAHNKPPVRDLSPEDDFSFLAPILAGCKSADMQKGTQCSSKLRTLGGISFTSIGEFSNNLIGWTSGGAVLYSHNKLVYVSGSMNSQ